LLLIVIISREVTFYIVLVYFRNWIRFSSIFKLYDCYGCPV